MKDLSYISKKLLKWYQRCGRNLPWRTTFTPYSVWLSEIMLQQTQVETVIPYFNRFLSAFPDFNRLAGAPLDNVMKLWEGLGYYSRARNLHRAAQIVARELAGRLPDEMAELLQLPGIGRSTAGAILSLAYNLPAPILDGNVRRVLSRLFAVQLSPGRELDRELWEYSEALVPRHAARDFNSALMDLGATVCRPKEPECFRCPLKIDCQGLRKNLQNVLPLKTTRGELPTRRLLSLVIWKKNRVYIRKREEKGLLGGLWEFPGEWTDSIPGGDEKRLPDEIRSLRFKWAPHEFLFRMNHTFTHFKMELYVYRAQYLSGTVQRSGNHRWVTLDEIGRYPFSAAGLKVIHSLKRLPPSHSATGQESTDDP